MMDTQGLNFFGYVKNNPLTYTDPKGMDWFARADGAGGWSVKWFPGHEHDGWYRIRVPWTFKDVASGQMIKLTGQGAGDYQPEEAMPAPSPSRSRKGKALPNFKTSEQERTEVAHEKSGEGYSTSEYFNAAWDAAHFREDFEAAGEGYKDFSEKFDLEKRYEQYKQQYEYESQLRDTDLGAYFKYKLRQGFDANPLGMEWNQAVGTAQSVWTAGQFYLRPPSEVASDLAENETNLSRINAEQTTSAVFNLALGAGAPELSTEEAASKEVASLDSAASEGGEPAPAEGKPGNGGRTGTGNVAAKQRAVDSIVREDFPNLKFSARPTYNPEVNSFGRSLPPENPDGPALYVGNNPRNFASRADLRDTLAHEEIHHRLWRRGVPSPHHPSLDNYIDTVIRRYFRLRGWTQPGQ